MKSGKLLVLAVVVFLAVCSPAYAQTNPNEEQGLKPFDSLHGGDLDSVSLTTGGLTLHIPLASFPQRGNLDLGFMVRFSNKQWYVKPAGYDPQGHQIYPATWQPMANSGVQVVSSVDWWLQGSWASDTSGGNPNGVDWTRGVTSPDGNSHGFGGDNSGSTSGPVYPLRSLDATGLLHPNLQTLILPNGTRYTYSSLTGPGLSTGPPPSLFKEGVQPSTVTDANGNQMTISASGWTDTMGRVIAGQAPGSDSPIQPGVPTSNLSACPSGTSSAWVWNVPGPANVNGGVRTFYFCYAMFTISTNFNPGTQPNDVQPTPTSLLSAIVLPDPTLAPWTFSYDSYGDVTQVGFPTGGSLSYTYAIGPVNCNTGTTSSTWVTSRTVNANDGTGGHTWTYNFQAQGNNLFSSNGTATVTSPDGNDTVHSIGGPVQGGGCTGYDLQTQYFQGPASAGVLLKTVQTQYSGSNSGLSVVPTQVATTLPGGQTAKAVNTYDALTPDPQNQLYRLGSLLEKDEYDFTNTLVRSTLNHYLWQDNSTYASNNFVSLPVSTTIKDGGGNQVAQATYGYDQSSLASSGIGTPTHVAPPAGEPMRGNRTTTSRWLDSSNSLLSSTATFFDTGMPASSAPPPNADGLNRTTTYSYSSTFLGAYVTQTNMPDTKMPDSGASVVHHVISGNYDFNTGLLTSFTDENSQNFTYAYDVMLRMTQGNHPDGGVTKFLYPDANTVERQRLITGSTYDDYKVKFDGVGRLGQTQQLTPDCSSYIKVDTAYDSVGRTATFSNPYCLTSEPTYGITQSQYDALSRVTKTIKQDGSSSSVQYNAPAGDGQGSSVVCTTATDEAGRQRQVCNDALGRMVKVLEPNPGAASTNATGWLSVSGSEQSAQTQQATSGHGAVTVNGTEQSGQYCVLRHCVTIWDAGNVTVTVNGLSKTVTYSKFDTGSTVASNLANAFNGDGNSPVNASASSNVLTLTAKATGSATNYSLLSSSATTDTTGTFAGPSFVPSNGSSLTGGQNAATTADTGTVSTTINGTNYTVSYGASDTSSTIAANLANAINAGSNASAAASGGTINLTSKTAGTAGDYSLSGSYTWNSGQFTNPSFTTSTSGAALSGALNAGAVNNNPYVTTYQYNARGEMLCVHQKATDTTADVACTGTSAPSVPAAWRQRFFTYDSFSRLLTAMNPENNSTGNTQITYAYDADSNVTSKNEPAPNQSWGSSATVTVSYTYDALNRLLDTTYSDGATQSTTHRYDYASFLGQTFAYPIGREVAATAANNTIEYFTSYDAMGREAQTVQCTPGVTGCKTFTANYGPVGQLLTLSYPGNGFTMTYGYDTAARLTSATDSNGVTYAQNPTILASGAMKEFTSPNFSNNKYHTDYNNRLQPTEIWTGSTEGSSALFDKQYQYNPPNASQVNNGNIYTVTNVKDGTRTQTFTYDALNRLTSAEDQTHWYNSYTYDAWGNLTQKTKGSLPNGENLSTSASTSNQLLGYTYDAAGNMLTDGVNGWTYVYDAENRITTAGSTTYTYDADGRRVKKSSGTNYWYGPTGAALAETDASGNWTNYIFFGGQRLARNVGGDIKYYVTDHLHSTAMFVDKNGSVLDDNDFYPWGGVVPGVGQTTSNNTVKFTGQYRDTESNLDYFGARYYANVTGRFMSPDWAAKPTSVPYAEFGDPQSLNLYSYVRNSPIVRVDADGHMVVGFTPNGVFGVRGTGVDDGSGGLGGSADDATTWISTTITFTDGTTQTLIHPADGQATQQIQQQAGPPDHVIQVKKEQTIVHQDKPGPLPKLCDSCYGAESSYIYEVVDKPGRLVTGQLTITEHVKVLKETGGATSETTKPDMPLSGGVFRDRIGHAENQPIKSYFVKTEQTWSVKYNGHEYSLTTIVNQTIEKKANDGWVINAVITRP